MIVRTSASKWRRGWFAFCLTILMSLAAAGVYAQPTTVQFAAGVPGSLGGVVLNGTGINPATGNFFRHLWTADPINGLCRLDSDIDTPGPHSVNPATCLSVAAGTGLNAGQLSFDPTTNNIYAVDLSAKHGIFRMHFLPSGDSGHGLIGYDPNSRFGDICRNRYQPREQFVYGHDSSEVTRRAAGIQECSRQPHSLHGGGEFVTTLPAAAKGVAGWE